MYNIQGDRNDRDREGLVLVLEQLRVQDDRSSGNFKIPWSEVRVGATVRTGCAGADVGRECRLLFDDAFWEDNKGVSIFLVTKREALTIETMFWHLEGRKDRRYNVMAMSITDPAHLITLLSANDSRLTMCWQLGTYPPGKWQQSSRSPEWVQHLKILTFS